VAEAFLSERGIDFEVRDVSNNFSAVRELVEKYQSRSTPTIVVGDQVMVGFDPQRLEKMLGG
jgi:glutaredoxin